MAALNKTITWKTNDKIRFSKKKELVGSLRWYNIVYGRI